MFAVHLHNGFGRYIVPVAQTVDGFLNEAVFNR